MLSSKHPTYTNNQPDWVMMRDAYEGERAIKDKGSEYLPVTSSMTAEGMSENQDGLLRYNAYKLRAVYHDVVGPAVEAMLGVMHRKPAQIKLPDKLEDMLETASFMGESLQQVLYKINEQQLLMGRLGAMIDVPDGARPGEIVPHIVTYGTENIFNWSTSRVADAKRMVTQFVVLNEAGMVRGASTTGGLPQPDLKLTPGLMWMNQNKYRVLVRGEDVQDIWPGMAGGYHVAETEKAEESILVTAFKQPSFGGRTLPDIPFVFIGSRDLAPEPDKAPLLALARIALAMYRTEADYREALFKYGQSTLAIVGATPEGDNEVTRRVGAGAVIYLPIGGSVQYVTAGYEGLDPMAKAIAEDKRQAAMLGASLLDQKGNIQESSAALSVRSSARTASLTSVAKASAEGLAVLLRAAATWVGADPKEVSVQPNLEFGDMGTVAADLVSLLTAKNLGAPISNATIHWWMSQRNFTAFDFETEQEKIADEGPDWRPPGIVDPNEPSPDAVHATENPPPSKTGPGVGVGSKSQPRQSGKSKSPSGVKGVQRKFTGAKAR